MSDVTVEALADRLSHTPRGTCVCLDELAGWFGGLNCYKSAGGADVPHYLAMHGARTLKVDRKTGDRPTIYIPHAAVCIVGGIQPDTLKRVLLPEYYDNGLAARLLLVMPPTKAKKWTENEIPADVAEEIDRLFDALFALKPDHDVDGDDEPKSISLTEPAREAWAGFVNEHNQHLLSLEGPARAAGAKLEGYAARFALVFHCIEQATGETDNDFIDTPTLNAGIALARWFGTETQRVYQSMHQSDEERERDALQNWIATKGGCVTIRDLQRHLRRYANDSERARADLDALVKAGRGRWSYVAPTSRGGRPTEEFHLTDTADADQTPKHNGNGELCRRRRVSGNRDSINGEGQ